MQSYILHTNWRSSCSSRLRIALNLKQIPYRSVYVDLDGGEHKSEAYLALNPAGTVPCLQTEHGSLLINQSLAAIEYLDETHPESGLRLLPSDPRGKAHVRSLAYSMACDVQPLTTSRVCSGIKALSGDPQHWSREVYRNGFSIYERGVAHAAARYSLGDSVTLADICLLSAVWKALMLEVKVQDAFPGIWQVYKNLLELEAVRRAHWKNQLDCPATSPRHL